MGTRQLSVAVLWLKAEFRPEYTLATIKHFLLLNWIKTFNLKCLSCLFFSDVSKVPPLVFLDCFLAWNATLNGCFYKNIWHENYVIISLRLILGSLLFHLVCVALQNKIKGWSAACRTGSMKSQLWLFKLTGLENWVAPLTGLFQLASHSQKQWCLQWSHIKVFFHSEHIPLVSQTWLQVWLTLGFLLIYFSVVFHFKFPCGSCE